jgi:sterol 24-C-methyltransferase
MGCGVGGPMRRIARFSGAEITGVTLNEYQVKRCGELTPPDLKKIVKVRQGDFTKLDDIANESFDKIFSIEAHCHVNPRTKPYLEAHRLLKKGGLMATYDWVMTPKYDSSNPTQVKIKKGIEYGDALPDLITAEEIIKQAEEAGFEVLEHFDVDLVAQAKFGAQNVPWYKPLEPGFSLENWKSTWIGRQITTNLLRVLEKCKIVPQGSLATAKMLEEGAMNLVEGGRIGIFTPMHFFLYRKK